jgi:hypothetical protein
VERESKSDAGNNRGNWNHLKIIQTIHEQQNRKARDLGTTENSHIGHWTLTAGSADVKVQDTFNVKNECTFTCACTVRAEHLQHWLS